MQKKAKIAIIVSAIILLLLIGSGITYFVIHNKSNNKNLEDPVASSTDVINDNTNIASLESTEGDESVESTANAIEDDQEGTNGAVTTTESSNADKDDDTINNDNKPNNSGNNGNVTTQSSGANSGNTTSTTESSATTDTKPQPSSTTEDTKPESSGTTESTTTEEHSACQHKWSLVDETIHHDAVYETQTVCVQAAYDENVYVWHSFCNGCGVDLTAMFPDGHYTPHTVYCQGGSTYHAAPILVDTIHHEAVYETKEVCVMQAWDEILTHTVCSICGYQIN